MRYEIGRLGRCAAALQCIAEEFREFAALDSGVRDDELDRFAGLLDHMAATLMVPGPIGTGHVIRLPAPANSDAAVDLAASRH